MLKKGDSIHSQIEFVAEEFIKKTLTHETLIISHFDTDGITSATIMIQTLKRLDRKFSLKIIKSLDKEFIDNLPKEKIILFLDLASGNLKHLEESNLENIFILDHHEIPLEYNPNSEKIFLVNPEIGNKEKTSASGITYLFCKRICPKTQELAKIAVLGIIGDFLEKEISEINNEILNDSEIQRKRGLMIYPSTRPINRVLEFCSNPYIPGITGDTKGVMDLLRECNLKPENNKYKSLIELSEEEMSKLITSILLRLPNRNQENLIGDIFLIKMFNKLEDARELSATINACSRLGEPDIAIQFCMEIPKAKTQAEELHIRYRQLLLSGLKYAKESEKITGDGFTIINAKNNIQDTIIGTIASIISNSSLYEEGTIITAMAYYNNKIKISARCVGRNGRNVREILSNVVTKTGGEVGGHRFAAGCVIQQEQEQEFIDLLKKNFEIEVIKI